MKSELRAPPVDRSISRVLIFLIGFFYLYTANISRCQAILSNVNGNNGANTPNYTYGYGITVGSQPLLVSALGLWDFGGDGINASRQVGIWSAAGQLQASVTVQGGTASNLVGEFRYENITPLVLNANTTYFIGFEDGAASGGETLIFGAGSYTVGSGVSIVGAGIPTEQGRWSSSTGFSFPDQFIGNSIQIGPNALYSVIPEPPIFAALFALTTLGFTAYRKRRGKAF